jgi:hypothetical protein
MQWRVLDFSLRLAKNLVPFTTHGGHGRKIPRLQEVGLQCGGLHLSPGGAFLAAASGTPLLIHVLHRLRTGGSGEASPPSPSRTGASGNRVAEVQADDPGAFDGEDVVGR